MIIDRYEVTKQESLRQRAYDVFQGIRLCATAHGANGFLARGVCHEDLKSIYMNSSRDQYTHAVHGLWHYAKSPLCSEETRQEIREILSAIADRMIRNVTAENDYDSLRANGTARTVWGRLSGWRCCRVGFDIIDVRRVGMPKRFEVLRILENGQSGYVAFSVHRAWDHGGHRRP